MSRILDYLISVMVVSGVIYHMVNVVYPLQSSTEHLNTHLAFAFLLVFLSALRKNRKQWPVLVTLILLSIAVTVYVKIFYWELEASFGMLTTTDLVVGVVLIILVLEACRQAMGWVIPIVTLVFLAYAFFGSYLPAGPFHIAKIDPIEIVSMLTLQFGGTGIYGILLEVSAYFIFLFTVMGGIMQVTGAPNFFRNLGIMVGSKLQGGPALMAVTGSALMGMVTGVATANIIVTGSFTIPLMKRVGYAPKEAAAIEAVASNGGQIMPPVMGATAFVMSVMTGIKYVTIMVAGFIPAVLYFLSLGLYVQLLAMKKKIVPMTTLGEKADIKQMLLSLPAFVVPLVVIIYLFLQGFSAMYVAFWGVVTSMLMAFIKPGKRLTWSEWLDGMTSGIMAGATIAITIAPMGIIVAILTVTGLGVKLPGIVEALSGGNLGIALILVMLVSLVLGMGVPTTPAYILVAIVAAPVLVKMGVGLLPAHFFVFYFAVMSLLTPPVAPAAIISSRLAGATYISTAIEASKAGVVGFLVPYIFVMNPIFLMQPGEGLLEGMLALLAGLVMVTSVAVAFVNYYFTRLNILERVLFLTCAVGCFVYLVKIPMVMISSYVLFGGAIILFILLTQNQVRRWRLSKVVAIS